MVQTLQELIAAADEDESMKKRLCELEECVRTLSTTDDPKQAYSSGKLNEVKRANRMDPTALGPTPPISHLFRNI